MDKDNIDLKELNECGLHDSIIRSVKINYEKKIIIFKITMFDKKEKILIELKDLTSLLIDKEEDLKNEEIILDFEIDNNKNQLYIFTTSNTKYKVKYKNSEVSLLY